MTKNTIIQVKDLTKMTYKNVTSSVLNLPAAGRLDSGCIEKCLKYL